MVITVGLGTAPHLLQLHSTWFDYSPTSCSKGGSGRLIERSASSCNSATGSSLCTMAMLPCQARTHITKTCLKWRPTAGRTACKGSTCSLSSCTFVMVAVIRAMALFCMMQSNVCRAEQQGFTHMYMHAGGGMAIVCACLTSRDNMLQQHGHALAVGLPLISARVYVSDRSLAPHPHF